ncbi:MAG TPA: cobalamin-independent methionine synthase II family protein [Vicinamibacterales bacterium]|nr:cobalamin-independent methionine synthase II family protein [Vicinamibacterales bacterium]
MVRPPQLMKARQQMRAGQLSEADYKAIEDEAVDEALRIQEDAGMDVVSDGEMRRDIFFDFAVTGMEGAAMVGGNAVRFHGDTPEAAMEVQVPFSITKRVQARNCPGLAEFEYAQAKTDLPVKVTVPSPTILLTSFWNAEHSREAYPDPTVLEHDLDAVVRSWIAELIDAGCKYIQIDAPPTADFHSDRSALEMFAEGLRMNPDDLRELDLKMITELGNIDRPSDVTLAIHLCKGNGTQAWIAEGSYDVLAESGGMARLGGYDAVHFEFDDERSGGFEPLAALPDNVVAILGLVTTKWAKLEDPAELKERIRAAAEFHPLDRLALAPQCGFASASETAEERKLAPQTQADKLKLVADVAHEVWQ